MLGLLLLNAVLLYFINVLFAEPGDTSRGNPMLIPFTLLTIEALTHFRPTTIGEKGVLLGTHVIPWNDIKRVEWDRDIKQQLWSFTLHFTKKQRLLKPQLTGNFSRRQMSFLKSF